MTRRGGALLLAATTLLASCAYYNGLYNTKDLAHQAEKLERQGRTGDARGFWDQVAVRAESVVVRHPHSKWTDEARYYQGKALARTDHCDRAVTPLALVAGGDRDAQLADEAALLLSTCRVKLGDLEGAGFAVERLIASPDRARRAEAGWRTGIAYRRTGRTAEAIDLLSRSGHPRARGELAAALADAGRIKEARALADSLLVERDTTVPWGGLIAALGVRVPLETSALLDTLLVRLPPGPDSAGAWLTADAARLLPLDRSRALARYETAFAAASARPVGVYARITGLRLRLSTTEDFSLLDTIPALLTDMEPSAGEAVVRASRFSAVASQMDKRLDSLDLTAPQGDLQGFFLGEVLRDSLAAPRLAAQLWQRVLASWPESPFAPKIILALAATGATPADSLTRLLDEHYATSPYVLALHGTDDPGFRILEDSLARYSLSTRARGRAPARAPVRGARPATSPTPAAPVP
jgi:tetratricopeptide (TPR) repeat protein